MREKIENRLKISVEGLDLTKVSNIEFYVRQIGFFGCYTPEVISSNEMLVVIPYEDARKLRRGNVDVQFAYVNETGDPDAVDPVNIPVGVFLKEAGYDPI
jgi:hypothetical protein